MKLTLSLIQILIICAVANSFVFSILVLEKKENRFANRFLFLTILSLCLSFTPYMLDPKIWHTHRWLAWLPFSLSYWTGPSFYFYIKLLTDAGFRFTKRHLWHFAPIILNYLHSGYHGILWPRDPWPWFHFFAELLESFAIVSILVYMLIAYRLISSYQKSLLDNVSNTTKIDLRWARQTIMVIITSFLMILVFLIVSSGISGKVFFNQWNDYRNTVLLLYAGVLYWIGIQGYRQTQTLKLKRRKENIASIPDKASFTVIQQLDAAMRGQKLFQNPELSITDLSKAVGISERTISGSINKSGKNFYVFINEYRVNEVQEKLKNPQNHNLKIISMAYDSGFNSKASFNRIFKSYTGLTPKEYQSQSASQKTLFET